MVCNDILARLVVFYAQCSTVISVVKITVGLVFLYTIMSENSVGTDLYVSLNLSLYNWP